MKTYDICTFNGEQELFEIRYNILKDQVDEFRVIEFDQTFSGKPRTRVFAQNLPKVKSYYITKDIWSKYEELALSSPNTQYGKGAEHWIREFAQKESLKDCLTDLKDDDKVFVGDCDEIWDKEFLQVDGDIAMKLKLKVYSYFLDNRSDEQFWGTLYARYHHIKKGCLNHLRSDSPKTIHEFGWHSTSQGGYENVRKKLTDSYTEDSYASPVVLSSLEQNINANKDFLFRQFNYQRDTSQWPSYLKSNVSKYIHLLKP